MKIFFLFGFMMVVDISSTCAVDLDSETKPNKIDMVKVQEKIASEMEDNFIPGLAAALIIGDKVVWAEGFGWANVEEKIPVTQNTPFMVASVSKTFTGTALMQAMEAGHFGLDTKINNLLNFTVDNPWVKDEIIQIKHLVTHTSGIEDNCISNIEDCKWDVYSEGDSPIPLGEFLENYLVPGGKYYDADINFSKKAPGTNIYYSNIATALAGYLMEVGTGVPLDDHSDEAIFAKIGMTNTGWHLADFKVAEVAIPYHHVNGSAVRVPHYGYPDYPSGQLRSSIADLGRYAAALLSNGTLDGQQLLLPKSVELLFSPPLENANFKDQGIFWWLGKNVREMHGHVFWTQTGWDLAAQSHIKIFREAGFATVWLMNTDHIMVSTSEAIEREMIKKAEELLAINTQYDYNYYEQD